MLCSNDLSRAFLIVSLELKRQIYDPFPASFGAKRIKQSYGILLSQNQSLHFFFQTALEEEKTKSACYCCPIKAYSQNQTI